MDKNLAVLAGGSTLITVLLGILFGISGVFAGVIIVISTASMATILVKLGFEDDFSIVFGLPASILFHSSLSYGLGFFIGIRIAFFLSIAILIVAAVIMWLRSSASIKKHHKTPEP